MVEKYKTFLPKDIQQTIVRAAGAACARKENSSLSMDDLMKAAAARQKLLETKTSLTNAIFC